MTSCTTRRAASSDPRAGTTTTSRVGSSTRAGRRRAPRWPAGRSRRPRSAGTACAARSPESPPLSIRSPSTRPGPMDGSCAGSPTITRCVPSARAVDQRGGELDVQHRRLVDDHDLGLDRVAGVPVEDRALIAPARRTVGAASGRAPSSRWIVVALLPASSSSRLAARPVGAASAIVAPTSRHSATIAATVRLLPVPGPPVSRLTPCSAASDDRPGLHVVQVGERRRATASRPPSGFADRTSRARPSAMASSAAASDMPGDPRLAGARRVVHPVDAARRRSPPRSPGSRRRRTRGCRRRRPRRARRCGRPWRTGPASSRPAPGRAAGRPGRRRGRPPGPAGRPARPRRPAGPAAATGRRAAPAAASSPSAVDQPGRPARRDLLRHQQFDDVVELAGADEAGDQPGRAAVGHPRQRRPAPPPSRRSGRVIPAPASCAARVDPRPGQRPAAQNSAKTSGTPEPYPGAAGGSDLRH